jgi:hypothetical protein
MQQTFNQSQCFRVPDKLYGILSTELSKVTAPPSDSLGITLNFRDAGYSAETGGYHPVEIRIVKHNSQWQFDYITDFSFQGCPYPELVKEIDICYQTGQVYSLYGGKLNKQDGDELIELFLNNFICYVETGVFSVSVTFN